MSRERDFEPSLASTVGKHPLGTSCRPCGWPVARPGWYGKAVEDAMSEIKTIGIIGGGLYGLAAGVSLSRQGFRVKLFETNEKIGGCCANTQLQGYRFNDGAMYVAVPEILDKAFEKLGLDR
jgi:NADPH-dependent 2,4-dienoyl-CoA reductase/sulfur reductase-like enzyme